MGIFSTTSPFDQVVEKATLETNTKEDWALILDVCDRVTSSPYDPKDCLRSIVKRLNHQDPHVVVQAVTLLDACVSNCGLPFHLEIASREFEQEFQRLLQKIRERTIREKLLGCLQKWALNEFKNNPQLDLIPTLYAKLRQSGVEFPSSNGSPSKSKTEYGSSSSSRKTAPGSQAVSAQQEQDDLAKAIELSLKESQKPSQGRGLYPSMTGAADTVDSGKQQSTSKSEKESRKVRALYDFEAAEDNELTFYTGEIVHVIDDSDPNWWEGTNQRGQGLFPSNFVTSDLDAEPSKTEETTKKQVKFNEEVSVASIEPVAIVTEIDETKIDQLLEMLHDADPIGELPDPPELEQLEDHVHKMAPLIDQELEKIDRSHAQLTKLGGELVGALNMYHQLMRGQSLAMNPPFMPHGYSTGAPPGQNYFPAGMPLPQMYANPSEMVTNPPANMGPAGMSHYTNNYVDPSKMMHPAENSSYGYVPYGNPGNEPRSMPSNEPMTSMPNPQLHHTTSPPPQAYGNKGPEHSNMVPASQPGIPQYPPQGHH